MVKKKRSKVYRKVWEDHNRACLLPGIHVLHIDGNPLNDSPENLHACTSQEHWQIHFDRGDAVAKRGKFVQSANIWESLSLEEREIRIESWVKGIKAAWADPEKRKRFIEARVGKKRSEQSRLNISLGRGAKPFDAFKINGEYVGTWVNVRVCAKVLNICKEHIWQILNKYNPNRKTAKGFVFKFQEDDTPFEELIRRETKEELRAKRSQSTKGRVGTFLGKKHSEDTKRRLSEIGKITSKGKNNPRYKGKCVTPFGTFEDADEASEKLGLGYSTVVSRLNKKAAKYEDWYYEEDFKDEN